MENANNHKQSSNGKEVKTSIYNLEVKDYKFSLNYNTLKNPTELLASLTLLKNDETLSNEEKINEVRRIVTKFME